jgi:hypothetical protein
VTRHRDTSTLGRSRRAPFVPGETPAERHDRRLRVALACRNRFENWLTARGLALRVANEGQHWQILRDGRQVIEWWPSSAKAVIAKKWTRGVHCHDVDQLRELIARRVLTATSQQAANAPRLERALKRDEVKAGAAARDDRQTPDDEAATP